MIRIVPLLLSSRHARRLALIVACAIGVETALTTELVGQQAQRHFRQGADMAPGQIGREQLIRGPHYHGYFQPVEVGAPEGAEVSLRVEGAFVNTNRSKAKAGMLIGQVYRCKITNIPGFPGEELYPSIEVIDRLFPPEGLAAKFPIPVHVTQEEIELALDGKFITRVIYLESPDTALPVAQRDDTQRIIDVRPTDDPLHAADAVGRPMAILRIGSRIPNQDGSDGLDFGSPPLQRLD